MSKFDHFKKLNVKSGITAIYELFQLEHEEGFTPTLILASATEANKNYYNALLKKTRNKSRAIQARKVNANLVAQNRDEDRGLYALHVVKGWENICDSEGEVVEFCAENVKDFLTALPDWIIDDIRNFAADIQNFIEDLIDTESIAKN